MASFFQRESHTIGAGVHLGHALQVLSGFLGRPHLLSSFSWATFPGQARPLVLALPELVWATSCMARLTAPSSSFSPGATDTMLAPGGLHVEPAQKLSCAGQSHSAPALWLFYLTLGLLLPILFDRAHTNAVFLTNSCSRPNRKLVPFLLCLCNLCCGSGRYGPAAERARSQSTQPLRLPLFFRLGLGIAATGLKRKVRTGLGHSQPSWIYSFDRRLTSLFGLLLLDLALVG